MSHHTSCWPTHLLLGWLNLTLTAPTVYLYLGLPLIMREHGWSGTEIGLFQLAGLPAILKFMLATPIDQYRFQQSNYRKWAVLLGMGYTLCLGALALQDIAHTQPGILFLLAMATALLATWADIPVNALAIRILPESERLRAGAIRSAATSVGAIVGGGVMLLVYARMGWSWPFWTLMLSLLISLMLLILIRHDEPNNPTDQVAFAPMQIFKQWQGYFERPGQTLWIPLLLLFFPFIGAAWFYLKPLLLDREFEMADIATIIGIAGGLLAAVTSIAGGWISNKIGQSRALSVFALLNLSALILLTLMLVFDGTRNGFIIASMGIAMAMGASAGLMFGLMMFHTRQHLIAMDYGIQSSLFSLSRILAPLAAGVLLDVSGYQGMLIGLTICTFIAFLLALRYVDQ